MSQRKLPVLIVGAGLAGLSCARRLQQHEIPFLVLDAADDVGGRIRTDQRHGFVFDRGFQVLLTSYPEADRLLDYDDLHLRRFTPGAIVRFEGEFYQLSDPWRNPGSLFSSLLSKPGTLADRFRIARLRMSIRRGSIDYLLRRPEQRTYDELRRMGFSKEMINSFFRPFIGGVFLNAGLTSSSRSFRFLFRMFAEGDAAVPAEGMAALPRQIASRLPRSTVWLKSKVRSVHEDGVTLFDGKKVKGSSVVVATDPLEAARLLKAVDPVPMLGVTNVYFSVDQSPVKEPMLVLNGEGKGPINNLCVISDVAPEYAPPGKALLSVTVLEQFSSPRRSLELEVRQQLQKWYGQSVASLKHLRTYRIPFALPDQTPPEHGVSEQPARIRRGLYVCGDYRDLASINGAMTSGRRAAEAVLADRLT